MPMEETVAKDRAAKNPYAGFQIPGLTTPPFLGGGLTDHPVVNTLTGGMDWIRQMWGGSPESGMAGFAAPTLDVEQIERRITDLKAVESWLQTNAAVLRTTIQALEVQRNTILALQSFGNFAAAGGAATEPRAGAVPDDWPMTARAAAGRAAEDAASRPSGGEEAPRAADTAAGAAQASMGQANVWWNLLQDQFARVAAAASGHQPGPDPQAPTVPPTKAARSSRARTAARSKSEPAKATRQPRAKRG